MTPSRGCAALAFGRGPLSSFADRWHDGPVFEHTIELPGGDVRTIESLHPYAPPLVVTVDGVRYLAEPVMTTVQAQQPWRYVRL